MTYGNKQWGVAWVGMACIAMQPAAKATEYEVRLRAVALSGEPAADTQGTWAHGGYFRAPVINNHGEVIFGSRVSHTGWPNGADEGIWIGAEGDLRLILREGQVMPGFPESTGLPTTLNLANYMTLSDSGHSIIAAQMPDPNAVVGSTSSALWRVSRDGPPELLLRAGRPGPGIPNEPSVSNILLGTSFGPKLADSGRVTVSASYSGRTAIWHGLPGDLTPVWVPEVTSAFGGGCVLRSPNGSYSVTNDERIAYWAPFRDPHDPAACDGGGQGLWREQGGVRELVATKESGGWTGLGSPFMAGDYYCFMTQQYPSYSIHRSGPDHILETVVTVGDAAPGVEDAVFTSVLPQGMNEHGTILIRAAIQGPSGNGSGVWLATLTGLEPLAIVDGTLPNGALMHSANRERINNRGDGVFMAFSAAGDRALYARNPRGETTLVAFNNQELEVRPGRVETIRMLDVAQYSAGDYGGGRSLNDHGEIVMWVSFGTKWNETGSGVLIAELVCPGDADDDGIVTLNDLAVVLGDFGNVSPNAAGDVDGDGDTDLADLAKTLGNFGGTCR